MVRSIKFRIILAFATCILLMAVLGGFSLFGLSKLNSNVRDAYFGTTLPIAQVSEVRAAHLNIRAKLRRLQTSKSADDVSKTAPIVQADLDTITKAWGSYYPSGISSADERQIADRINPALLQLKSQTSDAMAAFVAGDYARASDLVNQSAAAADALTVDLGADAGSNVAEANQFTEDSEATFRTILSVSIALLVAGVVAAVAMSAYLLRTIMSPLATAVGVSRLIAGGQLDNRITSSSRDEFGQLLDAFRQMDERLSHTVRGIQGSASSVTLASREIAAGNVDLSARTEQQATSLEETAASMTELTETVRQNADNARHANALASRATDVAYAGNEAVQSMLRTMEDISGSSSRISEITGVIQGIAFQTNILALNAAVEAARAGEQGRGFAVVASEVRSLAQRSADAAKEINDLIGSSVAVIKDGVQQAGEVGFTMNEVQQSIKQVSDIVGEIAAASEEQSRGIEQVNQAVNQMDEVTQQNAALVEQAAAAAQSLEEQAIKLADAVSVFKVADGKVSTPRTNL